jgi:hypothetical protein
LTAGQVWEAMSFVLHCSIWVSSHSAFEILIHIGFSGKYNGQPSMIKFLNYYFNVMFDMIVECVCKTEITHWCCLFDTIGDSKALFKVQLVLCLSSFVFLIIIIKETHYINEFVYICSQVHCGERDKVIIILGWATELIKSWKHPNLLLTVEEEYPSQILENYLKFCLFISEKIIKI